MHYKPVYNMSSMASSSEAFLRYALMAIVLAIFYNSNSTWLETGLTVCPYWLFIWSVTHFKFWYLFYHTIGRDLRAANFMVRLLLLVKKAEWRNLTVPKMFAETASKMPNKVMFYFKVSIFLLLYPGHFDCVSVFQDETWTFSQVEEYSNRVANYFLSLNFRKGDCVAIFMENRPEYVATWLGLAKIGVIPALINYNLKQSALIHTVRVANCKAIIYGVELSLEVSEVMNALQTDDESVFPSFSSGPPEIRKASVPFTVDLNDVLMSSSASPVPANVQDSICFKDKLLYIYTSGTTGLPKAAVIKHSR